MVIHYKSLSKENLEWLNEIIEESKRNTQIKDELMNQKNILQQRSKLIEYAFDNFNSNQTSKKYFANERLKVEEEIDRLQIKINEVQDLIQSQYDFIDMLNKAKTELYLK